MHDCCIRVTALLECFEWTWITGQGAWHQPCYQCQALGVGFGAIGFSIFKGRVSLALNHYWYQKGAWSGCASTFKTNE